MLIVNGELGQFCSRCGKWISHDKGIVVVTEKTRKNPHAGRIAWSRDGICMECYQKEENEEVSI